MFTMKMVQSVGLIYKCHWRTRSSRVPHIGICRQRSPHTCMTREIVLSYVTDNLIHYLWSAERLTQDDENKLLAHPYFYLRILAVICCRIEHSAYKGDHRPSAGTHYKNPSLQEDQIFYSLSFLTYLFTRTCLSIGVTADTTPFLLIIQNYERLTDHSHILNNM